MIILAELSDGWFLQQRHCLLQVALILSGTEESTSANAVPVSLWMDLRGDKC